MVKVSTLAIAGGSVLMAAGAGIYMQFSGAGSEPAQVAALVSAPPVAAATDDQAPQQTPLELDQITLTSLDLPAAPVVAPLVEETPEEIVSVITGGADTAYPAEPMAPILASISDDDLMLGDAPRPVAPQAQAEAECTVDMTGETRAAAMVALKLVAPCQPEARVSLKHEGMSFTVITDAAGVAEVTVPALSATATFLAMLDDGNGAAVEMEVDTLSFYDRSVVQWQGNAGVELHAFEFGAEWESEGHVWSGAPRESVVAARGEGGFLTRLGDATLDNARMAEVYTFPTGTAKTAGEVELSVEIAVTEANCGQALRAEVIEVTDARAGAPGELSLTVPGCDAVGDFIQLKNLVRDLKIAAR